MTDRPAPDDTAPHGPGTAPDAPESPQTAPDAPTDPESPENGADGPDDQTETFPAAVVKELRDENAKLRVKGKRSDDLATRLVHAMAGQSGRLADPTDLPYSEELIGDDGMPDTEKVNAAIESLLEKKPHLASTRPRFSDVGQGARSQQSQVSLGDLIRGST